MKDAGGYRAQNMWGPAETHPWRRNDLLVNSTCWRPTDSGSWRTAGNGGLSDPDANDGNFGTQFSAQYLENITLATNKEFQENYIAAGGRNAKFNFPENEIYTPPQLQSILAYNNTRDRVRHDHSGAMVACLFSG